MHTVCISIVTNLNSIHIPETKSNWPLHASTSMILLARATCGGVAFTFFRRYKRSD